MSLRSSPFASLLRSFSLRFGSAAALLGIFAISAGGCGGCDDTAVNCDAQGKNCQICDGYGCHPADPSAGGGGEGGTGLASTTTSTGGAVCDPTKLACSCDAKTMCNGKKCIDGICQIGCNFSYECGGGKVCANGSCTDGCDAMTPCAAGYTCMSGACLLDPANPACSANAPCAAGESCVGGLCTTKCAANTDCAKGEICSGVTGACIADPSPQPACSAAVMCPGAGQVCLDDGYCHYKCDTVGDCKLIDARFVACDANVCKTAEEVEPQCSIDVPCKAGLNCISGQCL